MAVTSLPFPRVIYALFHGWIFLLMTALGLTGCYQEQKVEVGLPEHESRPVINTYLWADSLPRVYIRQSQGLNTQGEDTAFVHHAEVDLRDGEGRLLERLRLVRRRDTAFYLGSQPLQSGRAYRVDCRLPNGRQASGASPVPAPAVVDAVTYTPDGVTDIEGFTRDVLEVTWQDAGRREDFYLIEAEYRSRQIQYTGFDQEPDTVLSITMLYLESQDGQGMTVGNGALLLNDAAFNGKRVSIRATFDLYNENYYFGDDDKAPTDTLIVHLRTLSESTYDYLRKLDLHHSSQPVGFFSTEPVVMYNNVEGGYGIVGGIGQGPGGRYELLVKPE